MLNQRKFERVSTLADMWVSWTVGGRTLVSLVSNLGLGGVFILTPNPESLGSKVALRFVVKEGEIRVGGVVRYSKSGKGMGVEFANVPERDIGRLHRLVQRMLQA